MFKTTLVQPAKRRGQLLIEFAVCIPALVLLVFGAIEFSGYVSLSDSANMAGLEGARAASLVAATEQEARQAAEQILQAHGVKQFQVSFSPPLESADRGDTIECFVEVPIRDNSRLLGRLSSDRQIVSQAFMVKQ
ncbi:TadE-like protein [Stieleria bergensis]|uniref:TadE-like protein n=1 Tax=Stieleria bergensis TaxID=2528025 RepID=A0A517SY01_9BACT|nr:TadE-like protein [Planctomycetes bacterium SV_7m_r]